MAAIALAGWSAPISRGASETAQFVARKSSESRAQLQRSYALGQLGKGSLTELCEVFNECRNADWDGYRAEPVSEWTFQLASELLEALPFGAPAPSISAEPDGHITLEWYRAPRRALSVSVSPQGELHYAALLGASKQYGTEPFRGAVSKTLIGLIHRVTRA